MPAVSGVVEAVAKPKKTWQGKFGGEVGHVGVKVGDTWYNWPFHQVDKPLPFQSGQSVSFMYDEEERNGYVNRNINKKSVEKGDAPAPAQSTAAKAVGGMTARDEYWRKKEERDIQKDGRIEFQAARRDAISAAAVMLEQGVVKLPQKQADKYDTFLSLVDAVTERFVKGVGAEATQAQAEAEEGEQEPEDDLPF